MSNQSRYLIICSDERTWKFDRPVIFLGKWCQLSKRKHIWENLDAITAKPYGLSKSHKDEDFLKARALEALLFPKLVSILNEYHSVNHSERFWQILLGHWLRRYTTVILNRVKSLEECLANHNISGITIFNSDQYELSVVDSYSAIWAFNDHDWNAILYSRILSFLNSVDFPIEVINTIESKNFRSPPSISKSGFIKKIYKFCNYLIGNFLKLFLKPNDAFIINSYLPKIEEFKLQLALKQCPQMWSLPNLKINEISNGSLRKELTKKIYKKSSGNQLQDILISMVFELLPICYLEGFKELDQIVKCQPWPKSPKFIFTSNNFDTDEVFKLWVAYKNESGIKYFVGQHGNNYGTYRYLESSIEEVTSTKFLTWGWTDGLAQHVPSFIFKNVNKKPQNFDPHGGLLLVEDMYHHRLDTWDRCAEFDENFVNQVIFTKQLAKDILPRLIVRLHASHVYNNPSEKDDWLEAAPEVNVDNGEVRIAKLISNSRLVVYGFDSTGILETLQLNIPTIAFWQNNLDHLRISAKPYYQALIDAGIVHLTPESAANKVNEIWSDVNSWWSQKQVQDARLNFTERYAKTSKNPIAELKSLLIQ